LIQAGFAAGLLSEWFLVASLTPLAKGKALAEIERLKLHYIVAEIQTAMQKVLGYRKAANFSRDNVRRHCWPCATRIICTGWTPKNAAIFE